MRFLAVLLLALLHSMMATAASSGSSSASTSSSSSSTSASPTMVWVTGTNAAGQTTVTQSPYSQQFSTLFSAVPSVSSGSAGLGSWSGQVGKIRSYTQTTVSQNAAAGPARPIPGTRATTTLPVVAVVLAMVLGVACI